MAFFSWFAIGSQSAFAWDTSWPSAQDLGVLPPYCKALLVGGAGSPEYAHWANIMGDGFGHSHHYCTGINYLRRALRPGTPQDKRGYYTQAITEISYVIDKAPRTYVLYPEMLSERGTAYARLKQTGKALADFEQAISIKPDYGRAYLRLSDLYMELNQPKEAKKVLQTAHEQVPQSTVIADRLQEIERKAR